MRAFQITTRLGALAALAVASGCSGGASGPAGTSPISGSGTLPTTPVTGAARARTNVKLFIPKKLHAVTSARRGTASTRTPQYVSVSTYGIGIVSRSVFNTGTVYDSESFSTDPNKNPNCQAGSLGTTCSFTIGYGSNDLNSLTVSAYDVGPIAVQGGSATAFPAGAVLLSTGSTTFGPPTPGATPSAVNVTLDGVVSYAVLASITTPNFTGTNISTTTIGGQGTPPELDLAVEAYDASENLIATDAFPSPITVTLSETGGSNDTTIADRTTTANGTTTSTPGTTISMTSPSDVAVVHYNGQAKNGYNATFTVSPGTTNDPNGVEPTSTTAASTGTLVPLFVQPDFSLSTDAPHATFAVDPNTNIPTITETLESGPNENPSFLYYGATNSTEPNNANAPQPGVPIPNGTCTAAQFPTGSNAPYTIDFVGGSSQNCTFSVGDGTNTGTSTIALDYTQPTGVSFFPSSFGVYNCTGNGSCASTYQGISTINAFSTNTTDSTFSITACTADANSGCYAGNNLNSTTRSFAYCMNKTGFILMQSGAPSGRASNQFTASASPGDYSRDTSDPNGQKTGDFTCTFTIADSAGTTANFAESFRAEATPSATVRASAPASIRFSKASIAYGKELAAERAYVATLATRQQQAAVLRANASAYLKAHEAHR